MKKYLNQILDMDMTISWNGKKEGVCNLEILKQILGYEKSTLIVYGEINRKGKGGGHLESFIV